MLKRKVFLGLGLAFLIFTIVACGNAAQVTEVPQATLVPTHTPTASATSTATPTPLPASRLELANRAQFYGDWDQAIDLYLEVVEAGASEEEVGDALLGRAKTYLLADDAASANEALIQFIQNHPDHPNLALGYFLRAQASEKLVDDYSAIDDYSQYLTLRPGYLDSHVREEVGDAFRRLDNPLESISWYEQAILSTSGGDLIRLLIKQGNAYLEASEYGSALAKFDEVHQLAADSATKATANYLAGLVLESQGDFQGAYARYLDSYENYPEAYDTYSGLIRLVEAGVPVDEFQRGLIDYYAGAYVPALDAFNRYLTTSSDPLGYYYRALTRRALNDPAGGLADFQYITENYPEEAIWTQAMLDKAVTEWAWLDMYSAAIDTYTRLVEVRPLDNAAPDALFAAGRTAERADDLARAANIWMRISNEYPASTLSYQGAFEAGIAYFRMDELEAAKQAFEAASLHSTETGQQAASLLWIGKTVEKLEGNAAALPFWREAAAADPTGYYSVRAEDLLKGRDPFTTLGVFQFPTNLESEKQEAEDWLRSTFQIEGPSPLDIMDPALSSDPRVIQGTEFYQLGMYEEAKQEFDSIRLAYETDPLATYRLMHLFLDLGLYQPAIYSSRQILNLAGMDDAATLNAPVYFNHIRFGPYFGDLILPEALNAELDGLFLLSVIRQESLFEGFATSYAAARGLMQVMPATGQEVADRIGWPEDFNPDDLYRPVISVRIGTEYLAQQRDLFEGDLFAALAAYNAGPGNSLAWKQLAPDDPDLFLEVIRLTQPHLYIRTIHEVFDIYRDLYTAP